MLSITIYSDNKMKIFTYNKLDIDIYIYIYIYIYNIYANETKFY